jgi:autoinducer 2-degrading protein
MLVSIVEVTVKPGMQQRFLELIKDDAEHSEADEPGCVRFDVLQDTEDERRFFFYEVYIDQEAHLAHRQTPHFTRIDSQIPDLFDGAAVHMTRNVFPTDPAFRR